MSDYQQKDLGYARVPTSAQIHFDCPDGSTWAVPVQVVVDSRDENYREDEEDTIRYILEGGLSEYEIHDWASNNMNWEDVEPFAHQVSPPEVDMQEGWVNGEWTIKGLR